MLKFSRKEVRDWSFSEFYLPVHMKGPKRNPSAPRLTVKSFWLTPLPCFVLPCYGGVPRRYTGERPRSKTAVDIGNSTETTNKRPGGGDEFPTSIKQ